MSQNTPVAVLRTCIIEGLKLRYHHYTTLTSNIPLLLILFQQIQSNHSPNTLFISLLHSVFAQNCQDAMRIISYWLPITVGNNMKITYVNVVITSYLLFFFQFITCSYSSLATVISLYRDVRINEWVSIAETWVVFFKCYNEIFAEYTFFYKYTSAIP